MSNSKDVEKEARIMAKKVKGEPKCPECNKSIDHLRWVACVNGNVSRGKKVIPMEYDKIFYYCPKCDALLFRDQEKASDFIG